MGKKLSMDELNRVDKATFQNQTKLPLILVLDNVRSMNNVGSAFRTADAFNIEKIVLCGITATPPNREISKTALGADETVQWEYFENIVEALNILKAQDIQICAIEQIENSITLNEFMPEIGKKYAYVFGNEVFGVSEEAVDLSNYFLEIPQFGTKHSLNIAVTLGITCWDFVSKTLFIK